MGMSQDIEKLKEQMKVINDLLRHPSKQASTVLYLVETIQKMESISYDLENKWNTAVAYLRAKGVVDEYNEWVTKRDSIMDPNMRQLFMLQPIGKPTETPSAPEACGEKNPFREDVTCFDKKGHEGEEHLGVDGDGKMWRWTKDEDLGEAEQTEMPEAPSESEEPQNEIGLLGDEEAQSIEDATRSDYEEQKEEDIEEKEPDEHNGQEGQ